MGPLFNYNEFKNILEERLAYGDELQLILDTAGAGKQKIIVRVNKNADITEKKVVDTLLEHYTTLKDMVVNDDLIDLIAEAIDAMEFTKIKNSGKLHKIIDNRKLTS